MKKRWMMLIGVLLLSFALVGGALAASRTGLSERGASIPQTFAPAQDAPAPSAAAAIYLDEDFETGVFPPAGWTISNNGGDCLWSDESGEAFPEGNLTAGRDGFADADSDACGSGTSMDTSLVSPPIDLTGAPDGTFLEFASDFKNMGMQIAAAEIINSGTVTWTRIFTLTGVSHNAVVHIDLTNYLGYPNTQIRFRFISPGWGRWWQVDNVLIAEPAPDVSISHDVPAYVATGSAIPYSITVQNMGSKTITGTLLENPMPPGASYVAGTLTCTGGVGGSCAYDSGSQRITWTGDIPAGDNVNLFFSLASDIGEPCNHIENIMYMSDTFNTVALEEHMGTEIVPQVFYIEDFEITDGGFDPSGEWEWAEPDPNTAPRGPKGAFNGTQVWGTNITGAYTGGGMLTGTIDLSGVSPTPAGITLQWENWLDLAPGDKALVHINNDVPYPIQSWGDSSRRWEIMSLDVSPYAGQVITVAFELVGSNSNSYAGWYIDSLAVVENCPYAWIGWEQDAAVCPGESAFYHLEASNATYVTQTFTLTPAGNLWPTLLSANNFPVSSGARQHITVEVSAPADASYGDFDQVRIDGMTSPDGYHNVLTLTTYIGDSWAEDIPAPVPGMDGAAISYGEETYYFSGVTTDTLKFTPSAGWNPLAPQPVPPYKSGDACFGYNAAGEPVAVLFPDREAGTSDLHVYNLPSNAWSVVPSTLPFPSGGIDGLSVASDPVANKCYLSGGDDGTGTSLRSAVLVYDVAANAFSSFGDLNTARMHHASWLAGNKLCVAGGRSGGDVPTDSTQCYDFAAGAWETENATYGHLPLPLWGMADAQPAPGEIWLLGGSMAAPVGGAGEPVADVFIWDSGVLTWTPGTPLLYPIYRGSADIQAGNIYYIGGSMPYYDANGNLVDAPVENHLRFVSCEADSDADVWLYKEASPPVVTVGEPFTYTFIVGNDGPAWATNVILKDWLPSGVTVTLPQSTSCVLGNSGFTCTLNSIPPAGMARVDVSATASITGALINQAIAKATEPDPRADNNIAVAQSDVLEQSATRPFIFEVFPPDGINITDTVITITGMNFQAGLSVTLDALPLPYIRQASGLIHALVPAMLPPGTYDISVINPDGQWDTAVGAFTVYGDANPQVCEVFPDISTNDIPVGMFIVGENFVPGATAMLSGTIPSLKANAFITVPLEGNYFINGNELLAVVPLGVMSGTYDVVVTNPDGRSGLLAQAYTSIDAAGTDLYAGRGDLWTIPGTVRSGEAITIGATVRRQGGLSTTLPGVDVAFFLGDPTADAPLLAIGQTGALPPRGIGFAAVSLDLSNVSPGYYDIYAVIDPADVVPEFDESNNIISRTLAVLPPTVDTEPPAITRFRINNGAQRTTDLQVSLILSATDNTAPAYMYFVEYAYLQGAGTWWPVQFSGWQPFDTVTAWALHPTPGTHYIQTWVADASGNVSAPRQAWIDLYHDNIPIQRYETHPYRLRLAAGNRIRMRLTSTSGDADLYVFGPHDVFIGSSENSAPVDEVTFTATQDGVYQIEVEGYAANSTYTLEVLPPGNNTCAPQPAGIQAPKQRGRNRPILAVGETPSSSTGLEEVPDTLHVIYLPITFR